MATEADTRKALQIILGFEESYLTTNSINSNLYDKYEPAHVQTAAAQESDDDLYTSPTSFSGESLSKLRDALPPQTGPSLLLSDPSIPKSTYVSSSKRTTGQPSYTENVIASGQLETALSAMSEKQSQKSGRASTHDDGKAPLAHLPWAAVEAMSRVQMYGHKKYKDFNNYRKGMEVSRNLSCALRHIKEYLENHDTDKESGENPLAHAMCRIAFVLQNLDDGTAIDDRYKPGLERYIGASQEAAKAKL